jgi:hypothetical protein
MGMIETKEIQVEIAAYDCGVAIWEIYGISVKLNNKITSGLIKTTFNDVWSYAIVLIII